MTQPPTSRDYGRFQSLLAHEPLPAALVDLSALEHNLDVLMARMAPPVTLRVATKSIRHVGILRRIMALGGDRLRGLMCFSAHEATWLAERGFDDMLLAYPVARWDEARAVAALAARGTRIRAMVDAPQHIALIARAAREAGTTVDLCLDVDVSWRPLPGVHLGVRRSPIRSAHDARAVALALEEGVRLTAVMAYEAQVAGLPDRGRGPRVLEPVVRVLKARSRALAAARRREVVDALRALGCAIDVINGGGTGSVASTSRDGSVTEVTAGSGFYCPHLFDGYTDLPLRPAAFFALAVARRSDSAFVTCNGGGYPASGAPGPDRLPIVHLPTQLSPTDLEGWGEVQTPFRCDGIQPLLGDPVICRHAKAGELAERFSTFLLVRGDRIEAREPTYRGEGQCFP